MNPPKEALARETGKADSRRLDVESVRKDFPILERRIYDRPLVYLDNAATTQRPRAVIEAVSGFYEEVNANVHRGVHALSQDATRRYEDAREKVRAFLGAAHVEEIIFTRGTTEAINLVAQTFGRARVGEGDEIVLSHMEHHSNIVPWQLLCEERGARLRVAPINDAGELDFDAFVALLNERTRLVAVTHVSNALGSVNPVKRIVDAAHERVIPVLVDGAQATPHLNVDVRELDCDFYAMSGHKMYGPTGIGVLYGKQEHLYAMPPWQGGGEMILSVTFEKTTYNDLPYKYEAGTPNIAGAIGLGAAVDYVEGVGLAAIAAHERDLVAYAQEKLLEIDGLRIIGTAREKAGVVSFVMEGAHPHDIGTILDRQGIAVRAGHHCAQPVMDRFGVTATARASFALYNTRAEVDALVEGLVKVKELFA